MAFLKGGDEPLLTPASVRVVAEKIRKEGSDLWFKSNPAELLAGYDPAVDPDAPAWLKARGTDGFADLEKSRDIFDVWFESGSSWNAVLNARGMGYPADLYLEGSDQHRGWFQLSLLPSLGAEGQAPFKTLLTHGFIVDADGKKMSKSLGNAIEVEELLKKYGADVCRWWVGSLNFTNDIKVDWAFFQTASEEYRKIRNTIRFCLGNLADFDPSKNAYDFGPEDAGTLDAWVMAETDKLIDDVRSGFETFQYRRVRNALFNFCNETLSAVYLAAIKDRLYCDGIDDPRRRRIQTALFRAADVLIRLSAPILVHTADEAYASLHGIDPEATDTTVHEQLFPEGADAPVSADWPAVLSLRSHALKALEDNKAAMGLQNPMDAGIRVKVPQGLADRLAPFAAELDDLCGISQFHVEVDPGVPDVPTETLDALQTALSICPVDVLDLRELPRCDRSWKRDGTVQAREGGEVDGLLLSDRDARVMAALS